MVNEDLRTLESTTNLEENSQKWCKNNLYSKLSEKFMPYRELVKEFKTNKDWKPSQFSNTVWKKNADKNRYADQICIDSTRVVLKERDEKSDYINASWMTMPDGRKWISTQGPIKETIEDFWHMIVTENVKVIVMLCQFKEDNVEKSAEYFNQDMKKTEKFGAYSVRVKNKSTEPFPEIKHTVIEVTKNEKKTVTVNHLWHTGWVDHFCPLDALPTVGLLKLAIEKSEQSPIVVHCSAGVGRTSTFIGIDYALQKISSDSSTKMLEVLFSLRRMRFRAIQSQLQYAYLHQCIAEYYIGEGVLKKDDNYEKLKKNFEMMVKKLIKTQSAAKEKFYAKKAVEAKAKDNNTHERSLG